MSEGRVKGEGGCEEGEREGRRKVWGSWERGEREGVSEGRGRGWVKGEGEVEWGERKRLSEGRGKGWVSEGYKFKKQNIFSCACLTLTQPNKLIFDTRLNYHNNTKATSVFNIIFERKSEGEEERQKKQIKTQEDKDNIPIRKFTVVTKGNLFIYLSIYIVQRQINRHIIDRHKYNR